MGNREYIITQSTEPINKKGDIISVYAGKGFFIDGKITDIRLSISGVYVIKVDTTGFKKYSYYKK